MASKGKDYTPPTRAELEAMRESKLQGAPVSEAVRREISFLRNVGGAGDDLEWILFNQAWTELGFERIGDWWQQRVLPVLVNLDLRPSPALADRVIAAISADEAALPKAQRRTQREIASIARTNQSRVSRSRPDSPESESDLEKGSENAQAAAADADTRAADGEQSRASNTRPPAAGADVADQSAPAVNPTEDHRDAIPGETGDSAAVESPGPSAPSGVFGADGTTEPEEPQPPVPPATGDVEGQAPVGMPASAPPIPSWLRAVTAVNAAIFDLRQEDPYTVQLLIPTDLAGELGASIKELVTFYKDMHKDLLDEESA